MIGLNLRSYFTPLRNAGHLPNGRDSGLEKMDLGLGEWVALFEQETRFLGETWFLHIRQRHGTRRVRISASATTA
jgi:hypothetical protein